ncbi:MAG: tRNA (N(6)-L-threonylcarbamoyladenosine(37)-C(2))-methylthiotransferase [Candidatus Hadarchaeales archaeon]
MRVYLETYGCTANRGDGEILAGLLKEAGHEVVEGWEGAEVLLLNTCVVKGETKKRMLRRMEEFAKTGKPVVVAGCLPLVDLPSVMERHPASVISCRSLLCVVEAVERAARGERGVLLLDGKPPEKPDLPKLRSSPVSAIVQIGEGCLSSCTFCSVRLARGRLRSFPPEKLVEEVREAVGKGYREILLTSQDNAAYGRERGWDLPSLLGEIVRVEGKFKVRVGMMNPENVKTILPKLVEVYRNEKVYRFLHLPLQSGDNRVLRMMGRRYTVEEFLEEVKAFREEFPDLCLVTDVIVGFPTETEEEFRRTIKVLEELKPDRVNLSRFSPMPGTPASRLPPLPGREVARRSRILSSLCLSLSLEANRKYVGWEGEALITEEGWKGGWVARLPNYKLAVLSEGKPGEFVRIRIREAKPTYLLAERIG